MFGEAWQNGADHNTDRDIGFGHGLDHFEAHMGLRGARFHGSGEFWIERGDGYVDRDAIECGHFAENIDVTSDEMVFGDDGGGVAEIAHDFETAAGDF